MKASQALKRAKKQLREHRYICLALLCAYKSNAGLAASYRAIDHIDKMLGDTTTVEGWLKKYGYIEQVLNKRDPVIYEYRLRWIDHLIEHFESLGD